MAKNSKEVKKSKKAIKKKGKLTNLKVVETVPKKAATKKLISKPKSASIRKSGEPIIKKATAVKIIMKKLAFSAKGVQKATTIVPNLPPVEEKSPEIIPVTNSSAPGTDIKSIQKEALHYYDNHHIHLSIKKVE